MKQTKRKKYRFYSFCIIILCYPDWDGYKASCIVDCLENITHSLCTLEFETYYWLLDALGLYQHYVWEYSRLNMTNTVMSKRKLNWLVTENYVDGWDDPRVMTSRIEA